MSFSRRDLLRSLLGSAVVAGCGKSGDDAVDTDGDAPPPPDATLRKTPWVALTSPTSARLRFETREDVEVPVWITGPGGSAEKVIPTRSSFELTYENPSFIDGVLPDEPGLHVVHELVLDGLTPGSVIAWRIPTLAASHEGAFRCPSTDAVRIGWLADTMWPNTDATVAVLATQTCDVVLHGGDMQYRDNPSDTWSGFFVSMAPLTSSAALHVAVGNHEDEKDGELEQMFDRLFAGQGQDGEGRYHAVRVGPALVLMLDSETVGLQDTTQPQHAWLDAQLAAANDDDTVKAVILGWHRPMYTFAKHFAGTTVADVILPKLVGTKVKLVMSGHSHSFEHFETDQGVHLIVDGSAGALLYDPDEALPEVQADFPDLEALRKHVERAYGCCTIDVAADGAITVRRLRAEDGSETVKIEIPTAT